MNTGFLRPAVLQQYLPLAVLKLPPRTVTTDVPIKLQQYLPLAVLKLSNVILSEKSSCFVATVLTACGIETYNISSALPS